MQGLRPDEFDVVALIYNDELSALGDKALYPVCLSAPIGFATKPVVRYLRKAGFSISEDRVCEPAVGSNGKFRGEDLPHGLRIDLENPVRQGDDLMSIRVTVGDLTMRPGLHVALALRRGTYDFRWDETKGWQIATYDKEYDFKDDDATKESNCK